MDQKSRDKNYGGREWMVANVMMGKGYGTNLTRAIELLRPEVILVDFVLHYRELDPVATFSEKVKFVTPFTPLQPSAPASHRQKPSVVASLSSAFQDQAGLIRMLCDILRGLDVDALVTTGHAFSPQDFSAGATGKNTNGDQIAGPGASGKPIVAGASTFANDELWASGTKMKASGKCMAWSASPASGFTVEGICTGADGNGGSSSSFRA